MAKYDVYPNPSGAGYLLDVQADLLDGLNTRVVVPLFDIAQAPKPAKYLNPVFDVNGEHVVMMTQFMASVPSSILTTSVARLPNQFAEITNALDMVFQGF
ncbi:MAG: CcdB family protein [Terasakiella sp.]|uniref:CcdB family protein n=1 Tax=unclassified Terasakiella TaxID=2614952 RepID=UPI003B009337